MNYGWLKQPAVKTQRIFFNTVGAYNTGTTVNGVAITCSRASSAYYKDGTGTWQQATNNQFRIGYVTPGCGVIGLVIEPAGTQLYPTPTSPASGTATLLATGTHIFWVEGTGSQQISAGTATCTGLPATASAGSPVVFNCTVTGTVTLATVTGSLSRAQLEQNPAPSSFMPTTGASRSADQITFPTPSWLNPAAYSMYLKASPSQPWNVSAIKGLFSLGGYNNPNSSTFWCDAAGSIQSAVKDASTLTTGSGATAHNNPYGGHDYAFINQAGNFQLYIDQAAGSHGIRLPAGQPSPATGYVGYLAGSAPVFILEAEIRNSGVLKDRGRFPSRVCCYGDSITYGYNAGTGFPDIIGTNAVGRYNFWNYGILGNTISQIQARYAGNVGTGFKSLMLLGGVNDLIASTSGATIWATWKAIADDAGARGMKVVALPVTPWSGYVGSTGAKQTETTNLNNSISGYSPGYTYTYVDIYTPLNNGGALAASYDSGDGLHPNLSGQNLIASTIWSAVGGTYYT